MRVVFDALDPPLRDGGYLLGLQKDDGYNKVLPAIAGVPVRSEEVEEGKAECIVMARPLEDGKTMTLLPHDYLSALYPIGSKLNVHVIYRASEFFKGRWSFSLRLKHRMRMISDASVAFLADCSRADGSDGSDGSGADAFPQLEGILAGTGLTASPIVEPWPAELVPQTRDSPQIHPGGGGYSGGTRSGSKKKELPVPSRLHDEKRKPAVLDLDTDPAAFYHQYRNTF